MYGKRTLKLLLQPLVENALYHGIKNKRGKGTISISGRIDGPCMEFVIQDNGSGMPPERLAEVLRQIAEDSDAHDLNDVYGLFSVARRLRLYYGDEARFSISSELRKGTSVTLTVPEVSEYV